MNRRVVDALGIRSTATHMEWFFGPKGLKFSEIGARPAGEKIWDMYGTSATTSTCTASGRSRSSAARRISAFERRLAVGSIQIRPDRDGKFTGHTGVEQAFQKLGSAIYLRWLPRSPNARAHSLAKAREPAARRQPARGEAVWRSAEARASQITERT
jgi:hypothetical protein